MSSFPFALLIPTQNADNARSAIFAAEPAGPGAATRPSRISTRRHPNARGFAKEHIIYLGTDLESLGEAAHRQDANSFDPCGLELGATYYWRVDEVNDARIWPGAVWTFTTADHLVVDDFEHYDPLGDPSDLDSQTMYNAWRNADVYVSEDMAHLCSKKSLSGCQWHNTTVSARLVPGTYRMFPANLSWSRIRFATTVSSFSISNTASLMK